MGAADTGFKAGEPRRADHGRPAAGSSRIGVGAARSTPCPGHVGRAARVRGRPGAGALLGNAGRSAPAAAWSARSGPDMGHTGGASSGIGRPGRPDVGRACGASWRSGRTRLAADRRAGTRVGSATAARAARCAIVPDSFRSGLGSARAGSGAGVGSSCRASSRVGRATSSACRTTGRALAARHTRRPGLGHACARVADEHAFRALVEPSGRSRMGGPEARGSSPRRPWVGAGLERLGSSCNEWSIVAADGSAGVGCPGGAICFEPPCTGMERACSSILGCA